MTRHPGRVVAVVTSGERGGGEYATVDLLGALARRGWRVTLLTDHRGLAAGTVVGETPIDLGPKLARRTVARVVLGFPRAYVRLVAALRRQRASGPIDVLIVCYKKEQLLAALLPRRLASVVVWVEWGPVPQPLQRGWPRRLYLAAGRRAAGIIAVSEGTRSSLVQTGFANADVAVVPPAIDGDVLAFDADARRVLRAEWGAGETTFVVGCISRLGKGKRLDVVIDALEHLDGDVLLVIAGDGEDAQALRARSARLGVRARFLPTPRGRVHEVLSACDVQVFAPSRTEGAPRAVAFGQLTGRPVIATAPAGAEDTIVPGTGVIVTPAHDPRALAACLEEYRRDPDRRAREGAAGRRHAVVHHGIERVGGAAERVLLAALE